jgi:hypothetical protein
VGLNWNREEHQDEQRHQSKAAMASSVGKAEGPGRIIRGIFICFCKGISLSGLKNKTRAVHLWLTSVILATQEAEIRWINV